MSDLAASHSRSSFSFFSGIVSFDAMSNQVCARAYDRESLVLLRRADGEFKDGLAQAYVVVNRAVAGKAARLRNQGL